MQETTWTAPAFEEVNLASEIGSYYENEDDPSFLKNRSMSPSVSCAEARGTQRSRVAPRGI